MTSILLNRHVRTGAKPFATAKQREYDLLAEAGSRTESDPEPAKELRTVTAVL